MRYEERIEPTPEMLAKGTVIIHRDSDGNFLSAEPRHITILQWLDDMRLLSPECVWAAHRYMACQHAYERRIRGKGTFLDRSVGEGEGDPFEPTMADDYLKMVRRLTRGETEIIDRVCAREFQVGSRKWLFSERERFHEVFEKLAAAVEAVHDSRLSGNG
ncbi:hypothetical protein [Limnoglobus roseus]|uniref:Uncharacterized protein n=1 Tax=Limnoglobus roseus TaxID=2598579 RepID=A0A5C1AEX1_9BACT|nr:hypothetical protein [Limnoglobus roseus]QEL16763.1 hypothetical protein PX52LOC_03732 [Limnoglobus roseus]